MHNSSNVVCLTFEPFQELELPDSKEKNCAFDWLCKFFDVVSKMSKEHNRGHYIIVEMWVSYATQLESKF